MERGGGMRKGWKEGVEVLEREEGRDNKNKICSVFVSFFSSTEKFMEISQIRRKRQRTEANPPNPPNQPLPPPPAHSLLSPTHPFTIITRPSTALPAISDAAMSTVKDLRKLVGASRLDAVSTARKTAPLRQVRPRRRVKGNGTERKRNLTESR